MPAFSRIALPRVAWNKRLSAYRLWKVASYLEDAVNTVQRLKE